MKARTLANIARSGEWAVQLSLLRVAPPFYRSCFVASAFTHGVLQRLAKGPVPFEQLADALEAKPIAREGLEAWLQVGVALGELGWDARGYFLRGRLSKQLTDARSDPVAALLQEMVELHHRLLLETPQRARGGRLLTLADQSGELIARSSRTLEPYVKEAIDDVVPRAGAFRVLEVGCGSGTYLRHAAARNRTLTGIGLELQPEVATFARRNLAEWGLAKRVSVEAADVRQWRSDERFDLVTLHNNIYYFPVAQRMELLTQLRGLLAPGGSLLVTTGCQGRNVTFAVLNLWAAMTDGCGPLPARTEMIAQLQAAGFRAVRAKSLLPGMGFYAFVGRN